MTGIDIKRKLRGGKVTLGAWLSSTDPVVAENMAHVGFDWLLADTEHCPYNLETLQTIALMLRGTETVLLVRVPDNDPVHIKQVLDLGAEGVMVPLVCTAEEARRAVAACKYPPEGIRGFGPRGASGFYRELAPYITTANDRTLVGIQIEHVKAIENLDDTLRVPGIDYAMIGPNDLSASMGLLGKSEAPEAKKAVRELVAGIRAAGVPVGMPLGGVAEALEWAALGVQFLAVGGDLGFMVEAASATLSGVTQGLEAAGQISR